MAVKSRRTVLDQRWESDWRSSEVGMSCLNCCSVAAARSSTSSRQICSASSCELVEIPGREPRPIRKEWG
nr:hypothetical protein CFP56_24322 [Quercus suber]